MVTFAENIVPENTQAFFEKVSSGWCARTSAYEEWFMMPREAGQCAVTALLVQDEFGGVLKRAIVNGESHYWNEIDGVVIDFTRAQFVSPIIIRDEIVRDRDYLLGSPVTLERYTILRDAVNTAP